MKKLLTIALLAASLTAKAGLFDSLTNSAPWLQGTNFMAAVYGISSEKFDKFGAGVALVYNVTPVVATVARLDYYDGSIWMPSGSLQLQLPVKFGSVELVPFAFSGIATPVSGKSPSAVGIFGIGAAVRISKRWDIVADYERWTGFDQDQIRFGALYKF